MTAARRPQQVTIPCVLAIVGASITLFGIFTTLSGWETSEVRDQVEEAISSGPTAGLDVSTEQVLSWVRIAMMGAAAVAVTAVIAGIYTLRGHNGARILLTVLSALTAVSVLVAGVTGVLLALIAAYSAVSLWSRDARQWFTPGANGGGATGSGAMTTPPPGDQPPERPHERPPEPPPYPGYAQPQPPPEPPPGYGPPPYPYAHPGVPTSRPTTVTVSGVITIVASAVAGLFFLGMTIAYVVDRDAFGDFLLEAAGLSAQDIEPDLLAAVFVGLCIGGGLLAAAALVLAVLLLRNSMRARIPLVVLSAVTILFALLFFPAGLLWSGAAIAVLVMLVSGNAPVWFEMQKHRSRS